MRVILWLVAVVACLHAAAAGDLFPEPYDSQQGTDRPLPPREAAEAFQLPDGFRVEVLAAEPTVRNPIAMSWDARGRLWIAENFTYAEGGKRFDRTLRDRVLVFEDADGDGAFEEPVVFTDGVQLLSGLAVGRGGVWLCCPPQVLFIPDADGDLVADGPAEVMLDGFEVGDASHHNFANGLAFGPDGWLYGRCGHSCPARIGVPGTPDEQRLPMEGGLWRYHVDSRRAEVLTTGTTNPWGHDWTAEGECFFVNTVNGHLWHMIPGAHFAQANGIDPDPLTYELIDQHADHHHFDTGRGWQASRDGSASDLGGGHAHSGCMVYQGLDWPGDYRGRLFTLNFHGRRINQEILERSGSGYVGRHAADLATSGDTWFRGIELSAGPDGRVVVVDWSDTGECHEHDGVHRSSGRLYRIGYGTPSRPPHEDLRLLDDVGLAALQRHPAGWQAMQARLLLAERAAARPCDAAATALLWNQLQDPLPVSAETGLSVSAVQVRGLLSLAVIDGLQRDDLLEVLESPDEHLRTWAVRLLTQSWPLDAAMGPVPLEPETAARVEAEAGKLLPKLIDRTSQDASGLVRLALASTLQRLPLSMRSQLAAALVARSEDAHDHNLPLMVWHGLRHVAEADPEGLARVAAACTWPTTRRLITRRLAERSIEEPQPLEMVLADAAASADPRRLADLLTGLAEAFAGWRQPPLPTHWQAIETAVASLADTGFDAAAHAPQDEVAICRKHVAALSVLFGAGRPIADLRQVALDRHALLTAREAAVASLMVAAARSTGEAEEAVVILREVCEKLVEDRSLATAAARGLARFDDTAAAERILEALRRAPPPRRDEILAILVSRRSFADRLLAAIDAGRLDKDDLAAYHVRQLQALGDPELATRVEQLWGRLRQTPAEIRRRIDTLTAELSQDAATDARDLAHGRAVYQRVCSSCHRLYGEGGDLGPDLTGSGRHDLAYVLENVLDPSAIVSRDWRLSVVEMVDGRILGGVLADERDRTVTLITPTERIVLDRADIASITPTDRSPMPEGLLDPLGPEELRNLVAYLRHPTQVPLP